MYPSSSRKSLLESEISDLSVACATQRVSIPAGESTDLTSCLTCMLMTVT
jgi:hypothetical protein